MTFTDLSVNISGNLAVTLSEGPQSFEAILGTKLTEYWDASDASLSGSDVLSLTGRIRGSALVPTAPANRPTFTAANALLGGQPSIDCTRATAKALWSQSLSIPIVAGFPFVFAIFRLTSTAGATESVFMSAITTGTPQTDNRLKFTPTNLTVSYYNGGTATAIAAAGDTNAHIMGGVVDAAGVTAWTDGALGTKTLAARIAADGTPIVFASLGCNVAGGQSEDVSIAAQGICTSAPSDAEFAAMYALAQSKYGVA